MAVEAAARGAGHVVRRALGGGTPPPDPGGSAPAVETGGGLSFTEVRQLFEHQKPTPIDRMFVERGALRDGAAVLAMQRSHDLAGGSAPNLDIRSINGWNEGYGPMDRRSKPARIGPAHYMKPRAGAILEAAKGPTGLDIVVASSSNQPPPPPPGGAKIRRTDPAPLFPEGNPYAQAMAQSQKAPLAADAALVAREPRERSPPRGDRRPLSTRNRSRERRAAAGGAEETYGQIRQKALNARSKTVPAEIFIGETPKRSRAVPPNQDALMRRGARTAATKRPPPGPAEDERDRKRGGAANVDRAVRRQRLSRFYADRTKSEVPETRAKKSKTVSLDVRGTRPEDKYGVRNRAQSKVQRASRSRDRGLVA